jgi:hypothetical protein
MSSPAIKWQSRFKVGCREIARVKEEIEMKLTMHMTDVKNWVSRGVGTITTGNAIRVLVAGVLLMAGTGMYFGLTTSDKEGNHVSSERTTAFPSEGWHDGNRQEIGLALPGIDRLDDQIAADLEACDKVYRSILPDHGDEVGNPHSSERAAVLEWRRSHLPGIDRLDDQIAAELEACDEVYLPFVPDHADEVSNPVSSK